jgi:ATP-dependent helicase/DNAse subunit B
VSLSIVVGPAHAGKVALLLARTLERLDRDPWLIVPNRLDVERTERELVARTGGLLAGTIGTFDTLFEHLAHGDGAGRRLLGEAERAVVVRRIVARHVREHDSAGRSASFPGYADALARTLQELDAALVEPEELAEPLAALLARYRAELDAIDAWDRGALRRRAVERLEGDLGAWADSPVLAYGFEDLTGAEWALLEALAARTEVHVSVPYEPGRAAYEGLARTVADLAALAGERVVELPPGAAAHLPPGLAHLERQLFADAPQRQALDDSLRFLEGAGERGTLELVAQEILALGREGVPLDEIAVVCPSVDALRVSLETAFAALDVPLSIEGRCGLRSTPLGSSLLSLLRFAWLGGERPELYAHLRSPYSGLARRDVDWAEGKLRGRGVSRGDRAVEVTGEVRGGRSLPTLDLVLGPAPPLDLVRDVAALMLRNAHGLAEPDLAPRSQADLRALDAIVRTLDELGRLASAGVEIGRGDVLAALERTTVRGDRPSTPGKVAVLDLARARTRRFAVVFVVGLEQGALPRRARPSPFLGDDERRTLAERGSARLERTDGVARDRYLFLTACTRPTRRLVLVRQATGEEGAPREASPFWDAVRELFDEDDVRRHTQRRPLSALTWRLEAAPTERERLRSLARLAADAPADAGALAVANGWERRVRRALRAFERPTRLTEPPALEVLRSREAFGVSDLERMAGCSAAWFVERHLRPGAIDKEIDRLMRGSILHAALQRFYAQLPRELPGAERVTPDNVEEAVVLMRSCVSAAVESGMRIDAGDLDRRELEQGLQRDLEQLVRDEAVERSPFVPRKLEVSFRDYELEPGVVVTGKIDRVDVDPMSARGIVVDYKSGHASSASEILGGDKLQLPLYLLVLRDRLGLEPMGGVYVSVGGGRRRRGILRGGDEAVPGFASGDYVGPEEFDEALAAARDTAATLVGRIREGDVRHDPTNGECPAWCDLWRICRKRRP